MALITSVSNPGLWASLNQLWVDDAEPGYVILAHKYYRVYRTSPDADVAFKLLEVVKDLLDTRSVSKSKRKTSYRNLDNG